jgi:hypothetical protein
VSTRARDPAAQFLQPPARGMGSALARIGETFRRWFGFGSDPR